jgi:predicted dehydrogenase
MVRIGIVGLGFMGMIHYLAARKLTGGQVTAVCSRDKAKLAGDWRSIRGNFGPPGEQMDLSHLKRYESYDDMLADPDIDLIDICNPTHLHPETAIAALKAGKHVLVEKAIALTEADAKRMIDTAKAAGKQLMVAHVLPFFPEFRFADDAVRSGKYGKLLAANFMRVIAKPDWSADIGDAAKTGGPAVDLHIHDTHFIGLLCGMPKAVFATGIADGTSVNHLTTQYLYGPGGPSVACTSGAAAMKGRPFVHGFEIYLERATLSYSSSGVPLTVYGADGSVEQPSLDGGGDPIAAFTIELQTAVDAVRTNQTSDLLSGQLACDALVFCHKECESVLTGQVVSIE